jgi:hypothetical protein
MLSEPKHELADRSIELEPDVYLARLRRMGASRSALLDPKRRAASGESVQAAARDEDLQHAQDEDVAGGRCRHRGLDRSQRGHEGGEIARRVQGSRGLAERLRVRIGSEPLDELPVRHATLLEALARALVILARGLDEERMALAGADPAAEGLFRRGRGVALPEECLDDHGAATRRAGRSIELPHRHAMGRADERALAHPVERGNDLVARGRERDRASGPLAERLARFRHAAPVRPLGRVGGGPRMGERIEDDAASWRVRVRVQIGER